MPTYDYKCKKCEHRFEVFQSINSEPGALCPICGYESERMIGMGAGFLFKGSGFYTTDYRSDSYRKAAESDKKKTQSTTETTKAKETKKVVSADS